MTIDQEIIDFTAFARQLAEQHQGRLSLDDAYRRWREIDPQEVAVLSRRLASLDAGVLGQPAQEVMADLRRRMVAKYGG